MQSVKNITNGNNYLVLAEVCVFKTQNPTNSQRDTTTQFQNKNICEVLWKGVRFIRIFLLEPSFHFITKYSIIYLLIRNWVDACICLLGRFDVYHFYNLLLSWTIIEKKIFDVLEFFPTTMFATEKQHKISDWMIFMINV